jgi:hypothetical protein
MCVLTTFIRTFNDRFGSHTIYNVSELSNLETTLHIHLLITVSGTGLPVIPSDLYVDIRMKNSNDPEGRIHQSTVEATAGNATLSPQHRPPISLTDAGPSLSSHPVDNVDRINDNDSGSHESCSSCLWTGVLTCIGLSAYFAHAAYEIPTAIVIDKRQSTTIVNKLFPWLMKQQHHRPPSLYHKPVFLMISAGWLCVGAYRWHIG